MEFRDLTKPFKIISSSNPLVINFKIKGCSIHQLATVFTRILKRILKNGNCGQLNSITGVIGVIAIY